MSNNATINEKTDATTIEKPSVLDRYKNMWTALKALSNAHLESATDRDLLDSKEQTKGLKAVAKSFSQTLACGQSSKKSVKGHDYKICIGTVQQRSSGLEQSVKLNLIDLTQDEAAKLFFALGDQLASFGYFDNK